MCKLFITKYANCKYTLPLQAYDVLVTSRQSGKAWTVHSQGCAHPGSHIVLPLDAILDPSGQQAGHQGNHDRDDGGGGGHLANQLLRLRYGVFASLDEPNHVTGEHYTHCQGRTVSQVCFLCECEHSNLSAICTFVTNFTPLILDHYSQFVSFRPS